uniref:Uncharacterized protein n=1 Tax=Amphimedon queenslandica TaxID=400682 RepID=A0A1X7TJ26_AMPQE
MTLPVKGQAIWGKGKKINGHNNRLISTANTNQQICNFLSDVIVSVKKESGDVYKKTCKLLENPDELIFVNLMKPVESLVVLECKDHETDAEVSLRFFR